MPSNIAIGGNDTSGENLRDSHGAITTAYYVIGSVGILGNMLVIVVIFNFRAMKNKNVNVLVLNQSLIDALASVLIIAQTRIDRRAYLDGVWGDFVCRFWLNSMLLWGLLTASNINILSITLERYLAVVHPIRYRNVSERIRHRLMAVVIGSTWIAGLGYNCAIASTTSGVRDHRCCSVAFFRSEAWKKTAGLVTFLFPFLLPIVTCIVCYVRIIQTLRQKVASQTANAVELTNQGDAHNSQRKTELTRNVHTTFCIVLVCSILCNTGNNCLFLAFNFGYSLDFTGALYNVSVIASFANCCVNPFIYSFKYKLFQQGLRKLFCRYSLAVENSSSMSRAEGRVDVHVCVDNDTPHSA